MRRKNRTTTFLSIVTSLLLFGSLSLYISRNFSSSAPSYLLLRPTTTINSPSTSIHNHQQQTPSLPPSPPPPPQRPTTTINSPSTSIHNHQQQTPSLPPSPPPPQQQEQEQQQPYPAPSPPTSQSIITPQPISILIPDWEVLLVFPSNTIIAPSSSTDNFTCLFPSISSPAKFTGILPSTNRSLFKCHFPESVRRPRPYRQPLFSKSSLPFPQSLPPQPILLMWKFFAYESLSTKDYVTVFAKGVNSLLGINRPPETLHCVFFNEDNKFLTTTPVITSAKEVFRCKHPELTYPEPIYEKNQIKVTVEIIADKRVVPSVAYYAPLPQTLVENNPEEKVFICACTMVYNEAKFLREWVIYHAKIGIGKFIFYDNVSDDDLYEVIEKLRAEGYKMETVFWPWAKAQESGFSHCAVHANDSCTWMAYIDVDEFIFSPSWAKEETPSSHLLRSLLPKSPSSKIGEISMYCYDFGPSNQRTHPVQGVTQGYTCRRNIEERHKSIVLIHAIDDSLHTAIHHFEVKKGYHVKKLRLDQAVVNHYKYQAWPEFKKKFKGRVSAYVVDWRVKVNPGAKDRTPGLGFEAIEPKGWDKKFCQVRDYGLKNVTRRWFRLDESSGFRMAWQEE